MSLLTEPTLSNLIVAYGYWAIFGLVAAESSGVPLPGETALLSAAIYAGTTHRIDITTVILAAAAGAVTGDNLGFLVGREAGFRLLLRYGRYLHVDEARLKLGQYLFLRYGGGIVFFGRFVAILRVFAAVLAGANRMPWRRFLVCNAASGVLWATLYGTGGYMLGDAARQFGARLGMATFAVAAVAVLGSCIFLRINESRLAAAAESALPGPVMRATPPAEGRGRSKRLAARMRLARPTAGDGTGGARTGCRDDTGRAKEGQMAGKDAKQKLVQFLDERAFQPVLRAKAEDFPQDEREARARAAGHRERTQAVPKLRVGGEGGGHVPQRPALGAGRKDSPRAARLRPAHHQRNA
jgi:membrane protein DedA with SNARE-associated domain